MIARRLSNRLATRIAAPIILSWTIAGALLYWFVLSSTSEFLEGAAGESMEWVARAAYNIMDLRQEALRRDGMDKSPGYLLGNQIRAREEIEAFLRQYKVEGLVVEKTATGPKEVLSVLMPMDLWTKAALDVPAGRAQAVTAGRRTYYVYACDYAPWNWRLILAKPPETYEALRRKALTAYLATGLILLLGAAVVLYSQYVSVNVPIMRILRSLKDEKAPVYRGTYEFEYLSDSIRRMMASLAELNQNLEGIVRDRTRTLEEKARELSQAYRKLMELDDMKSAFLSSISHELRTPLTSIRGFAKLTLRDFDKACRMPQKGAEEFVERCERMRKNLGIIMSEGDRLTRLVNDVLDVNEIESGRAVWRLAEASPASLLAEAAAEAGPGLLDKPGLRYAAEAPDDLPMILCDPDRLRQALFNILDNAAKFTEKGVVSAKIERSGTDRVRFSIRDQGAGIEPEHLDRIFDRFHQISHEKALGDKPSGTGLGLTLCRLIVEKHGGEVAVHSEPGRGSLFTIDIPIAQDASAFEGEAS